MSFSFNNKLSFIDSFRFLSSSLDNFVKKLAKYHLKYLSQEFAYTYEYMNNFEKFNEQLPKKEVFYSLLTGKKLVADYQNARKVWNKFEMKMMKDYHNLYLKYDVLL